MEQREKSVDSPWAVYQRGTQETVNKLDKTPPPWPARPVKVALAQFAMTSSPAENLETAVSSIREAASQKADIVCLPELFRTPYFCRDPHTSVDYTEEVPGEVGKVLSAEAKNLNIAIVAGSVYERTAENKRFNTAIVINRDGELCGTYRKVHIPHDPSFYEKHYFEPGDQGFKVFDLGFAKVGVLICYDQWFPEAARSLALMGAEIIFYPTAIARVEDIPQDEGDWQHAWETVQCGHAIANNVVVCPVNRVGIEGNATFWGGSFICDGFGRILAKGSDKPELVIAEVDLEHSAVTREGWGFFRSRQPTQYNTLTKPLEE